MGANKNNITRDEIIRLLFLKKELKYILLKSIVKNQNIKNKYRGLCFYKLQRLYTYKSRQNNVCIFTGKIGGVYKFCHSSRHIINKKMKVGEINLYKNK